MSTKPIDIYADQPTVDLACKIAVMQYVLEHGTFGFAVSAS